MQVMPPTGKELNVGDIAEVEPNIHAGVKYMRFMMDQYFKDEPMDDLNKGLMTFAAYNAGPGRMRQLRRETEKRGLDPNVWFGNVERVASERIGRETVTYVSNIYKYDITYRLLTDQLERRDAAKAAVAQKGGPVAMWKLSLDPTQKALITQLQASRETWHQTGTYNAEQYQEPPEVRRRDGASLRKALPHTAHAGWKPPKNRPNPVDIVVAGNAGRQQHLVPLRMARMSASPFAFLRGAAAVMAWDLSHTPVTGIQVVINGDAHINNFGLFGSLQREVIIDMNDFDEATLGPWEWDLKRLVASVNVAGRENGMSRAERRIAVMQAVAGYRFNASRLSTMGVLDCGRTSVTRNAARRQFKVPKKSWAVIQKVVAKAKATTNATLLAKVAQRRHDGGWRFVEDRPILTGIDDETRQKVVGVPGRVRRASPAVVPLHAEPIRGRRRRPPRRRRRQRRHARLPRAALRQRRHRSAVPPDQGSHRARPRAVPSRAAAAQHPRRLSRRRRATHPAVPRRSIARLHDHRRQALLRAADEEHEGIDAGAVHEGPAFNFWASVCGSLLARAHSRSGDVARIDGYCGERRHARPRPRGVRGSLRRPDRARPRRAGAGHQERPREGRR